MLAEYYLKNALHFALGLVKESHMKNHKKNHVKKCILKGLFGYLFIFIRQIKNTILNRALIGN